MSSPISFDSSFGFAFVSSKGFARNFPPEVNIIKQLVGVRINFTTPGPLSAGQFDLNRNRFFMQDMMDHLAAFPYPAPQNPNATDGTVDTYTVTAQSDASGNMINIIYTKAFTSNTGIPWNRTSSAPLIFLMAAAEFRLRTALNSNPPRYNQVVCSKLKFDLGDKKFPVCISQRINTVVACENSLVEEATTVEGQWRHSGSEIELFPVTPNFGTIETNWDGARRVDVYENSGGGARYLDDTIVGPTPACCQIA